MEEASTNKNKVDEPDPPNPMRKPKMKGRKKTVSLNPMKKNRYKEDKEKSVNAARVKDLTEKKKKAAKVAYLSHGFLRGFVDAVTQDFVSVPTSKHFAPRGVSHTEHAKRWSYIRNDWEEANKDLHEQWVKASQLKRMHINAEKSRKKSMMIAGIKDDSDSDFEPMGPEGDEMDEVQRSPSQNGSLPPIR